MYNPKFVTRFLFLILVCVITASLLTTLPGRTDQDNNNTAPEKPDIKLKMDIKELAKDPDDPSELNRRLSKNHRYERGRGKSLTELPLGKGAGRVDESPSLPPLPLAESDLVILGKVIKAQPYLSAKKTSIYSEFTAQVQDVFKNNTATPLSAGESI